MSTLNTELNSLGNNSLSNLSPAVDLTGTNSHLWMDLWLHLAAQGSARQSGATVEVHMSVSLNNGTTYGDNVRGLLIYIATFTLDATANAVDAYYFGVRMSPGKLKLSAYNSTGVAFASSGNTVSYELRSMETA